MLPNCRAQWRSALHHVLEGQAALSPEDVDANLADAAARADDLQVRGAEGGM
jgi:hypothetical protein